MTKLNAIFDRLRPKANLICFRHHAQCLESPFSGLSFSVYFLSISRKKCFFSSSLRFTVYNKTFKLVVKRAEAIFEAAAAKNYKIVIKKNIESRFLYAESFDLNLQYITKSNEIFFDQATSKIAAHS